MELMSIGEFARMSRLSQKALRLYDELGLLPPAQVDAGNGYRLYEEGQLERARLVASLRHIGMPLAGIGEIVSLDPEAAAARIEAFWASAESHHADQRELAIHLVDSLRGKETAMYEVDTRKMPLRQILCLKRHVEGESGAWALGKEFIALARDRQPVRMDGVAGATFAIYYGEVNEDSDGPVEWCRPVPDDSVDEEAKRFPELTLRTEAAHEEAYVELGKAPTLGAAKWQLISDSLRSWAAENGRVGSELAPRLTYVFADDGPDCDFAVPLR